MKRIAHVLSGVRRNEQGFSMAEIVVAITFFVAAILGASSMLVSGVSLIGGSAMANTAMRLASAKIEEVKSIPFYVPWVTNPADIDDSYWRFDVGGQPLLNAEQITAPWRDDEADPNGKYQKYGDISGFLRYKRTTTVQYVYVVGTAPNTHLEPAVMNSKWVPSYPVSGEDDRPMGGADTSATDQLHMLTIEVKVSYMENGTERTFTERALAGDLIGPGSAIERVMVVESISPNYGYRGLDDFLACRISVYAPQMTAGEEVVVTLWRAGCSDIPTKEGTLTTSSPSTIDCHFDLETITDHPLGYYNISVYWKRMGFKDSNLRNCFELREGTALRIHTVKTEDGESPAWGFEKQDARTLSIDGHNFTGANAVNLRSGVHMMQGGDIRVSDGGKKLLATFDPSLQPGSPPDMQWALEVKRGDGSTDTKPDCFILNPRPQVTGVADPGTTGGIDYFDWAYNAQASRNVKLTGDYLYALDNELFLPFVKLVDDSGGPVHECTAVREVAVGESDINHWKKDTWVIIEFNPSTGTEGGFNLHSKCSVVAQNYGGISSTDRTNDTQNVWMNPAPVLSSTTIPSSAYRKTVVGSFEVRGSYFQKPITGPSHTFVKLVKWPLVGEDFPIVMLSPADISPSGDLITFSLDLSKQCFTWSKTKGEVDGKEAKITGDYKVFLVNADGQVTEPNTGPLCTINHAPLKISGGTVTSAGANFWDVSLGNLTVDYFLTGDCNITMWDDNLSTSYDPYGGYATVEGTPVVTGNYGTGQTASGLTLNLIAIPTGAKRIRIKDAENGQSSTRENSLAFNVNNQTPKAPYWVSPVSVQDDGTRTVKVRAQGLAGLNGTGGYPFYPSYVIAVEWRQNSSPYGPYSPKEQKWSKADYGTLFTNRGPTKYVELTAPIVLPNKDKLIGSQSYCCLSTTPWYCVHDLYVAWYDWSIGTYRRSPAWPDSIDIID